MSCLCGNTNVHTPECKREESKKRYPKIYERRKKQWKERRENKCCVDCNDKVKRKIVYPARCDKCNDKANGEKNENN